MLLIKRSFKKDAMRKKDDSKKEALFRATQQIVNKKGFSSVSMSKIAKAANVAPATLYTYFKNTDDLLDELFMKLDAELLKSISENFDEYKSYEKWFRKIWKNCYQYFISRPDDFHFCQQFQASPRMHHLALQKKWENAPCSMRKVIEKGQKEGLLKKLPKEAMFAFVFLPVVEVARMELTGLMQITPEIFQKLEDLAWDILSAKK